MDQSVCLVLQFINWVQIDCVRSEPPKYDEEVIECDQYTCSCVKCHINCVDEREDASPLLLRKPL